MGGGDRRGEDLRGFPQGGLGDVEAQGDLGSGRQEAGRLGGRLHDGRPRGQEAGRLGRGQAHRGQRGEEAGRLGRRGGRRVGGADEGQSGVQGRLERQAHLEPGLQGLLGGQEDRQPGVRGGRRTLQVRRLRLHRLRFVAGQGRHHLRQRHHHRRQGGGGRLREEVEGPQRGGEGREEGGRRRQEGGGLQEGGGGCR